MPYGDANAIVVEMAGEVLPIVAKTPVLAGVCGTDPFRMMNVYLRDLKRLGFSGVQNFPTVGLIDGIFRANLEETGMGYALEVDMITQARNFDLLTCPYVFNEQNAKAMAAAGADLIIAHMGLTTKGTIGAATSMTLDESVSRIQAIQNAAADINPDILVLCHGGPIAEPEDVRYVLGRCPGIAGFFGASSMERLPVERAITEQVKNFKSLSISSGRSNHA
jgi:predicted TIM-barrel enzyme